MTDAGPDILPEPGALRRGWTTGSCATAAAKAAYVAWRTGDLPASVVITLPGGGRPEFVIATGEALPARGRAGVIKDAGDDPDATAGVLVIVDIEAGPPGSDVSFRAGPGVGTVTLPGLKLPVGEPAINPVPRRMIATAIAEAAEATGGPRDVIVTVSIPHGEEIARQTMNGRLGILGGLSILGTTGIVIPYSCSAWIHSIHRGIDVARATGIQHVAASTGSTSEAGVALRHGLSEQALIEMGDFVGGTLKYLRRHPVPRLTIAGGFAKMVKLGQGLMDLHSRAGSVDRDWLAERLRAAGGDEATVEAARRANTANEVLDHAIRAGLPLAAEIADAAWRAAAVQLDGTGIRLDLLVFDRAGAIVAARDQA